MEAAYEHLWAAGYDLPPDTPPNPVVAPRRGKKAAKAKRQKVGK